MNEFPIYFRPGNVAVITGASSGIGLAMTKRCAITFSMNVFCVDIDEAELTQSISAVQKEITGDNKVMAISADVSDYEAMVQVRDTVLKNGFNTVHFLFNNAGTGRGGGALSDIHMFQKVVQVNSFGVINCCNLLIPLMKEKGEDGLIVTTGSKQGITMPPGNLAYNASKSMVKTYAEGLEHELMKDRKEKGGKLRSVLLVPGWVNTSILFKAMRDNCAVHDKPFDADSVFFHESKPASGAWMPSHIIDFLLSELQSNDDKFYVICPDNEVDRETDNIRMMWAMQDITEDRVPLSRWHPEYSAKFTEFLENEKKKNK